MQSDPTLPAASEPDYRVLFAAMPAPLMVLTPDFRIAAVNDAFVQASLTERDAMVGRDLFEVFPDNPGDPLPAGSTRLRESLERVLRTREPDTMAVQKYDVRVGDEFSERYWSVVNIPLLDAAGALTHILHRPEDVTEFRSSLAREAQMESRLDIQSREIEHANRRLRDTTDSIAGAVFQFRMGADGALQLESISGLAQELRDAIELARVAGRGGHSVERTLGYVTQLADRLVRHMNHHTAIALSDIEATNSSDTDSAAPPKESGDGSPLRAAPDIRRGAS